MKKRIISLLLAFVMTFSLLPTMAWAADNDCSAADDGSVTWPYDADTTTTVTAKTLDSEHSATCQVTVLPVSSEGEAAQKPGNTDKPVNTNNAEQQEDAVLDEEASKENEEKNKTVLVTSLRIVEPVPILTVGTPYSLDNLQLKFAPEDATNTNVTWTSENDTIVTVADGTITPVAEGETYITAKTVDGSEQSAKFEVTVEAPVSIKSIQVNYPSKENLHGFSFSPDITNYNIEIADGVACNFFITPDNLPQNKCFFAQLYKDGQPIKGKNGSVAPGTFTRKNELKVDKNPKVTLMASNGPALGTSGSYSILIGTKENDVPTANFTKIYCTYNFNISTKMPRLGTLKIADEKNATIAPTPGFNASKVYVADYSMAVPASSSYIQLTATAKTAGVTFLIGGETYNQLSAQRITLDDFKTDIPLVYRIPICLQKTGEFVAENTYHLTVTKKNPTPVILSQPGESTNNIVECQKGESTSLSVTVQAPEEGELSYQWFSRASGTYKAIPDAKESTYIPDTSRAGSILYKCAITNTLDGIKYSVDTKDITVKVNLTSVDKPQILLQPGTFTIERIDIIEKYKTVYSFGESLEPIYIALDQLEEGEVYSYNWYYNTENTTTNGTLLEEEHTGPNIRDGYYFQGFKLPHKFDAGTYYIYCEVTASSESDPNLKATTTSEAVEITFNEVSLDDFEGSGSESDPYLIQSADDLVELRELVNARQFCIGLYFKMTQDVTLPAEWKPIGRAANADEVGKNLPYKGVCAFRGIFDGGGHTLTVPEGGKPLFNYVGEATIKNLNIYGKKIDGYGLVNSYYIDYGTDNVYNYGDPYCVIIDNVRLLSGSQTLCAGFLDGSGSGINTVTIRNSVVEKDVIIGYDRQQYAIGSFVGGNFNGVIENCESYADVYGISEVGGLAGNKGQTMGLCKVQNSRFYGNVVATGNHVGGIIGRGYPEEGEVRTAPNSPWVTIVGCTVTGSITGKNYVGGIFGAETSTIQCWGNDFGGDSFSANSSGSIRNNSFTGKINARGNYVGAIAGYLESLNRYTVVADNYYSADCGVNTGIGFIHYIDTSCETHETTSGAIYFDTSKEMPALTGVSIQNANRTDDPLGADAEKLCYTEKRGEKYVDTLSISGYKKEYQIGDPFDTTGMVFTATWSDGTTTNPDPKTDIQFVGFDSSERGEKTIQATYKNATVNFTIIVKQKAGTIDVTISILGDSKHGANGSVHTYAEGGLTTWVGATTYTVDSNATVWTVLKKCLDENGYTYSNSTGNYVASINGLAEFTNGKNSGWMYTLNGSYPMLGVSQQYLNDGDVIVFHYTDDYTLEAADMGPAPEEKKTADEVIALINAIGVVDLTKGDVIAKARAAYDALSAADKKLVTNYQTLLDAEAAYAKLVAELGKKADSVYKTTGDYLAKLGTPGVGSIGGEWMALGLARSGRTVPEGYYDAVVKYVKDNIDSNGRLDKNKATENARIILALTAIGKDVTNVGGHDLLAGLNEMSYLSKQGINGAIFTLIALDSHNYTPAGDVTRDKLVQAILDAQISGDGGWSLDGKNADVDMTAMAIQALAAYYKSNSSAKKAVDKGLSWLSSVQQNDGGFTSWGAANSESCAQVIVALTALGINPAKDSRFIKNGVSVLDALCSFAVNGGGFKHLATETSANGMATEQGFYALVAYYRLLNGQSSLYDMTDVKLEGVKAEKPVNDTDKPDDATNTDTPVDTEVEDTSSGGQVVLWVVIGVVAVGGIAALAVTSKKRHGRDAE